jgi:outer membrane protein assembly factor BamD
MHRLFLPLTLAIALAACASTQQKVKEQTKQASAEEIFHQGVAAFDKEKWQEASEFFQTLKSRFPYSRFATEAELYLADVLFRQEKFAQAAEAYEDFAKLHPSHPRVPYAMLQVGRCHVELMPRDWFLIPPAYELDQSETMLAIEKLRAFLERFPQDSQVEEGRKLLQQCLRRLAERARYCMDFYRKRHRPRAVVQRADEILQSYPGTGFDDEALWRRAEARLQLKEEQAARQDLEKLLREFPQSRFAADASRALAQMAGKGAPAEAK